MPLSPEDLQHIAARNLAHYEQHAQSYWEGTRDHDVSQNIEALLKHIAGPPPFDLLDFGCGPGRDLRTFKALGHRAVGVEGAPSAAALARANSGCEVLPQVLRQLQACLRPGGVLFSSNPRGDGQEGWNGERYGVFHDWPSWRALVTAAGFDELEHFYRPPGLPIEQQPWLASVWRKR